MWDPYVSLSPFPTLSSPSSRSSTNLVLLRHCSLLFDPALEAFLIDISFGLGPEPLNVTTTTMAAMPPEEEMSASAQAATTDEAEQWLHHKISN